ncbi:hypothetical protein OBV_34190 [Oscillibacter valericigenes Sjm18-20]|nr:hypothetical protein OBV_34190 [Oscillibacter valericigenes Sjm18-20]
MGDMPEAIVSILGADYESVEPMRLGGTGELFWAHKRGLDVDVVIKRCQTRYRGYMDDTREARILKNLRHQYLPRIYDVIYAPDGFAYTVMDYILGCNLEEYVRHYGALPQKQTVKWLRQLCQVTAYLHSQKPPVIHCDLKPQNIMITPEGDICVIDFNTSLLYENQEMQALGATCGYAAPEQYHLSGAALQRLPQPEREKWNRWNKAASHCGKVTERTDLYAIGAIAYFMMTGYTPGHCLEEIIPLNRYRIQMGDSLRAVIEKAMQKEPQHRFSSAKTMLTALENLKKTDRRYRTWRIHCQLTSIALSALMLLSVFSIWMGREFQGRDQQTQYQTLITEADSLIESQQYEKSLVILSQAISLNDVGIEAYSRTAKILYRLGRYSDCIAMLSELTFVEDDSALSQEKFEFTQAELNYVLGSCYYQIKDYGNAVRCLELAVWFAPEEPLYCRDLAIAQAQNSDMEGARETYAALKKQNHVNPNDVLLVQGELDYASGDYAAALKSLLQLTGAADEDLSARSYLLAAQCYQRLGNDDLPKEIALLEEACAVLPVSSLDQVRQQLADAYLRYGTQSGDATCYTKALEQLDGLADQQVVTLTVLLDRELALQHLNRYPEALKATQTVVEQYPNDYRGYVRLALLYLSKPLYDADAAQSAYAQASTLYAGSGEQSSEFVYLESLMGGQG